MWQNLHRFPFGTWLFSRLAGRMVPYTGTILARVETLRPGYAEVSLRDRRRIRNHLGSIHAVALVNLGEFTSGLAFVTALPIDFKGIVTRLEAEYLKKARGRLVARSIFDVSDIRGESDYVSTAEITDAAGDVVARFNATWNIRRNES